MALDKAIKYGKEFRKIFRGSKSFDASCRCHGSCSYCSAGRLHAFNREKLRASVQVVEYFEMTDMDRGKEEEEHDRFSAYN